MTRFRRLADDEDDTPPGPGPIPPGPSFGSIASFFDLERGLFRMQSADPASIHKSSIVESIISEFGIPALARPTGGVGALAAIAEIARLQIQTNHPPSPQAAAAELARLYDLFAQSAKPTALLTGRKQLMEATLMPAFMGNGNRHHIISTIVRAVTVYWLGAPVTGGGVVTAFVGGPELSAELNSIFDSGPKSSRQVARRLARCFMIATTRVQYTIPPSVVGFMTIYPPITIPLD